MDYTKLTIPELLEEEEKTQAKRNMHGRDTNTWRQCDAKIEKILAELARRATIPEELH